MTEDKDATLRVLFNDSYQDFSGEAFTAQVMERVGHMSRRRAVSWIVVDILVVLLAWLIAEPLQTAVFSVMPSLTSSLIQLESKLVADMLLPVNNLATVLALSFVILRSVYKRIFS